MIHTAHGYWLAEAGAVEPAAAAGRRRDRRRRRHRRRLHGPVDGVAAARARRVGRRCWRPTLCGHGPSGRNGGFCETLWTHLPSLVERFGRDAGARRCAGRRRRACARSARGARSRASTRGSRRAGYLMASTAPAHDAVLDEILAVAPRDRVRALDAARRCARAATRRASAAACSCPTTRPSSPRGSRSGCATGCADVDPRALARDGAAASAPDGVVAETAGGRVRAGAAVLAVNAATRGFRPLRDRLSVTSSHIVLTEPVPGRARGARLDRRRVHHRRPHVRALLPHHAATAGSRSAGAEAGSRRARGSAARRGRRRGRGGDPRAPRRDVPARSRAARSPTPGAARSTSRRAICRRSARSTARPSTTRSASPATASARPTSPAAPSPRWRSGEPTDLAVVDPEPVRVPPEPFAFAGGMLVRRAFLRKERLEEEAARVDPLTRAVAAAPRALGIHVGR